MKSNRTGEGGMFCVADHHDCELISSLTIMLAYTESVTVEMNLQNIKLIAPTVYRPLNTNSDYFHPFVDSNFPYGGW